MGEQLTESDVKKIKEEIEYRKIVVRKKELEAVKEARAQGDLSENFEYKAAKQDKNRNESRIRYLEKMIRTAKIISTDSADDEVGMNNTVEVYFEDEDEEEKIEYDTILMIGDASGKEGQFSDSDKKTAENFGCEYMDVDDFVDKYKG